MLHEHNLFVTVKHHEVPWIGFDERIEMEPLGHDCWQVTLNFGFKNDPDVPEALKLLRRPRRAARRHGHQLLPRRATSSSRRSAAAWPMWREKLFASMHRNAAAAADFLNLPTNRVVELGAKVEI